MKAVFLFLVLSSTSFASDILVVGGKPYDIKPATLPKCGEVGSPEFLAAKFILNAAQAMGETTQASACKADPGRDCSEQAIKKNGIKVLFTTIRRYPSYAQEGCKVLRQDCESKCIASKLFSDTECFIECNQYESYHR